MDNSTIEALATAVAEKIKDTPQQLLYSTRDVLKMCGISRTTLWRAVKEGSFPAPRRIRNSLKWTLADLETLMK